MNWHDPLGWLPPPGLAGFDEIAKVRRGMLLLAAAPRPPIGITPHAVVHGHDKLAVRYYPPSGTHSGETVVVVPSLINRAAIVDLEPGRSLVAALAAAGHRVYLVDWGVPGEEDGDDDVGYVLHDLLLRSIARIRRHGCARKVHLFGYCLGGTLAVMATALRPDGIASVATLAAPARFSEGGRFAAFARAVDPVRCFPSGLVPVDLMKPVFKSLDPMGNWNKHLAVDAAANDPNALRRVLARERWVEENIPLPSAFAREWVRFGYHEDRLLAGTWTVRGEAVNLGAIGLPVLVLACESDFITPLACALPLAPATGGVAITLPTGHLAAVVGAAGPRLLYPLLDRWVRDPASVAAAP